MLTGHVRDPIVGRDLLIGVAAGIFWVLCDRATFLAPKWMGKTPSAPISLVDLIQLGGGIRTVLADLLLNVTIFVFTALVFFFAFFLLRLITKREWPAAAIVAALFSLPAAFGPHAVVNTVGSLFVNGLALVILIRFGLLAMIITLTLQNVLEAFPLTDHVSAWYGEPTIFVFALLLAVSVFAFYTSTAGKPLFGSISLE